MEILQGNMYVFLCFHVYKRTIHARFLFASFYPPPPPPPLHHNGKGYIGHPLVSWQYTWGQGTVDLARFTIGLGNVVLWGPLVEVHCNWELAALHLIIQEAKSVIRDASMFMYPKMLADNKS